MARVHHRCSLKFLVVCSLLSLTFVWIFSQAKYDWSKLYLTKLINNTRLLFDFSDSKESQVIKESKHPTLILDTPGCKIPKLDPYDSSVSHLFTPQKPYICPGLPLFLFTQPNGSICLNDTILDTFYNLTDTNVSCVYQSIRRKYEKPGNVRENDYDIGNETILKFGEPLNEDHIVVNCELGNANLTQYIPIPRLIKEVEDKRSNKRPFIPQLNVIVLGIDSISKLNFIRYFSKTRQFFKSKLYPFEMKGYSKVGDNTFPNLIALLSGHFAKDVWNETVKDTMYFDGLDLIWKRYAERGYRTFFTEDMPVYGTFNYGKRGFHEQPTDYYFRPLSLALYQSDLRANSKEYCFNSQTETDIMYDYLRDFLRTMGPRPYFAFMMISALTHDYLNYAAHADEPTSHLLHDLWDFGTLNNSVLIFFSDHGMRFGAIRKTYIGKFEERMPFMYLHFPSWFLSQYPQYSKNLRSNQERLITLFDVHTTLLHLLEPSQQLSEEQKSSLAPYGTSLLNEISPYRTCEKAWISAPWCICQILHDEALDGTEAIESAAAVINFINGKLMPYNESCAVLELDQITDANSGQISDLVLRFVKHEHVVINTHVVLGERIEKYVDYVIKITTKPGNAYYEVTVRYDVKEDIYNVLFIRRINPYESNCIDNQRLQMFCYCI